MQRKGLKLTIGVIGLAVFALLALRRTGLDFGRLVPGSDGATTIAAQATPGAATPGATCAVDAARVELPAALRETSGISRTTDGSLWTHNDGDEARLYRITEQGAIAQVVDLAGIEAFDLEDIDAGPCPDGSGECLWVADIGDNDAHRPDVALLVVPVPAANADRVTPTRIPFTWPGGARDAEALAVLPTGDVVLVTKGRDAPIAVYRLAVGDEVGAPAARRVAEEVVELAPRPEDRRVRVSGAGASEDGSWIAIRNGVELAIFDMEALLRSDVTPALTYDLSPLRESQGEGVELASDGRVWLTSEGERGTPTLARLRCSLPE